MAIKVSGTTVIDSSRNADVNTLSIAGTQVTATAAELNILDGLTVTTAELNNVTGINSSVQTQLDGKLTAANNLSDLTNAATARTNLGLDNIDPTKATLTKSFVAGEVSSIALSAAITSGGPVVAVTKEVPQTGVSSKGSWDVSATASNYELYNEAPATSLSLSSTTADGTATLGTGSFSASDVGKRIFVDDGGEAILTATDGSFSLVSEFGASTYTSGNWSLSGLDVDVTNGITLSEVAVNTWDVSTASFFQTFSVAAQETSPSDIFFKPDGLKMYVLGEAGQDVNEYNLSTAWDVSTASFLQSFSVSAQDLAPNGLFFRPDGLKMYFSGGTGDDVNEYNLSTAWDISTATFLQVFSVAAQETSPNGLFFKPDGTKMYVLGSAGDDVNEYDLSTAWNISTASFLRLFSVAAQETIPTGIFFRGDGLKMYVIGSTGDDVNEYNLSTAWNISTASFLQVFSVAAQETGPQGIFFKPDGLKMYVVGNVGDAVYEYNVGTLAQPTAQYLPALTSTAGQIDSQYWTDINGMTADDVDNDGQVYYAVSTDDRTTWKVAKASDGERPIVRNNGGTWEYNSAEGAASIENASLVGTRSVTAQDTVPTGIFFKPDGTRMYIGGLTNDRIYEYNLSIAWNVSSASFTRFFSNSVVFSSPRDVFFREDGLKMYILDDLADDVFEYNLSTAWDISTSSYFQAFSIFGQAQNAAGLFFKPDGTEMYIADRGSQDVHQYTLSTAWNISTASFTATGPQTTSLHSIQFTSDGFSMYLKDQSGVVSEYTLSTAWLISSATATGVTFASGVNSAGATLADSGDRLYIVGNDNVVYQYSNVGYTTSATWNSATTNNEFAAIAEALGETTVNQMDKVQLDAVTDAAHFTLGDTLDLAIVPYLASAGTAPTSDAVAINYDAAVLNQGAVLGTDYDYDFPATDVVRLTSLATQNLNVRIV